MTPDELQRILRTESEYQHNIERIDDGGGLAYAIVLVVMVAAMLIYYGAA